MNAPIQGTAADIIKRAMIDVDKKYGSSSLQMLLQVHDELIFETPDLDLEEVEGVRILMEDALPLNVPVRVDAKAGDNWLEMSSVARA
jgi:DNA polymerase-1